MGKRSCESNPQGGEACDSLPAGVFCRQGSCLGGCERECRCTEGVWDCAVRCRDTFSALPIDCGTPPLCRDQCEVATLLPDGGIAPSDASFTAGHGYAISFTPFDLTTLWGTQGLRVAIGFGPPLSEGWTTDLSDRVSLRTWPEMEEIPSTLTVATSPSDMGGVTVTPNAPLSDRWYALRLSAIAAWMVAPAVHIAPDGSYVARFRTGSDPRVRSVTFAGGPSKHRLYIEVSEPVAGLQSSAQLVRVQSAGAQVACSDAGSAASMNAVLSLDCPALSTFPGTISIDAGFFSSTAMALAPTTIEKVDLILSSTCGQDCQVGRVP